MKNTVSERIKALRIAAGMTQEQLGDVLGVGKATVQKYESGQIQNLKTEHIRKLCLLFKKRPHYFIFEEIETNNVDVNKLYDGIEILFGSATLDAFKKSLDLNDAGKARLLEYIADLSEIEKYKKR